MQVIIISTIYINNKSGVGRFLHECIRRLICTPGEESLECLCMLLNTVGQVLEHETIELLNLSAGYKMFEEYFKEMEKIISDKKATSRIWFLLQVKVEIFKTYFGLL